MTPEAPRGYLAILLHAHLPYVREPDHERFLEEAWFYEAMTETYLPLLRILENLAADRVEFRLTMSLTPTLVSMFDDELLRDRYERRLDELLELSEKEVVRHRFHPTFHAIAEFYRERFSKLRDAYLHRYGRDLTGAFRRFQERGLVEIVASAATHGFLPLLRHEPSAVRAQVAVGVQCYRRSFGIDPQGMWLPECGYYPGLDEVLAEHGIRYFVAETHGVLRGSTRAHWGAYAPVVCPSGVAAFPRDPECTRQVWSREDGFPGHPDYREFYRDIGFSLPADYIRRYVGPDGLRVQTGIKYHRITGKTEAKEPYVRELALRRAAEHAEQFLAWREAQVDWLRRGMDRRPIVLAPYDAELFGHWWFEGPEWLDGVLRRAALPGAPVAAITPSEYLAEYREAQVSTPCESSWGYRGHNEFWLNGANDWVYPRLHAASRRMARLAFRHRGAEGRARRVLNQAARELLLAQASDWAFILRDGTATGYARGRVEGHLDAFERLADGVGGPAAGGGAAGELLEACERRNAIFPDLEFEVFEERIPRPSYAAPESLAHVVFLAAEGAPYVKVGGLADVIGALPKALARLGVRASVFLPAYRAIDRKEHRLRRVLDGLSVPLGGKPAPFSVLRAEGPGAGVRTFFIEDETYFGRAGVYVDPETGAEYPDAAERFIFFTKAALEALDRLGEDVDVVHAHDHQTALAPAYLKIAYRRHPRLGLAASVYTLHNLGYQGICEPEILEAAGFGQDQFHPGSPFEHRGKVNFMKAGIHFADKVNTVSPGYAREIREDERLGAGLGEACRARGEDFSGILNGIDAEAWDPARDRHIPKPYGREDLSGKREAKLALIRSVGLDAAVSERPLAGMITRLVDQKGLDLLREALDRLMALGISLVVLGSGLPKYEEFLRRAKRRHAGRLAAVLRFDEALAHLIEAGADMFLMPSLYEPCGLNQMYSLRYGTVPVVRRTGGLADTVADGDEDPDGDGFAFEPYEADALIDAVARAVRAYRDPARWERIVRAGMSRDFSWDASALRYLELYREALAARA
ncbi:MAG: 1,4-alpha-glucan branching protein domain-containing protein [Planctomycetota bacterium]